MSKAKAQPGEVLVSAQRATGSAISKLLVNLNRIGKDNITIDVLKAKLLQLDAYWKSFFEKHQSVYEHAEDLKEDDYFTRDYFSDIEETYLDTKIQLTTQLSAQVEAVQALVGLPVNDPQGASPAVSTTASSLPKLTLPKFSGRQEDWESFKELFCSMVKDAPSLTPVLKLQHLISCLEGDARRRVGNMTIVGANFEVAWNTLEKRYDNKRLRLTVQLNRLLSMRPAAEKSVAEITRLLDTTNQCVRSLSNMRRSVEHWDDWLVQLVVFNLDRETREDWEKSLEGTNDFPTYATLTTFLENRTKALDTAHCSDSPSPGRAKLRQNPFQNAKSAASSSKSVSAHLASSTSHQKSAPKPGGCLICKREHYTGYCPALLQRSVSKRRDLADSLRLCLNCLRAGHPTASCPSRSRCKHCNGQHHSALHQEPPVDGQQSAPGSDFASAGTKPDFTQAGNQQLNAYTMSLGKATLLGTARVVLKSKAGLAFEFRALVDPCSEGSFISEKAAQALRLPRTACQTSVTGVGGEVNATSRSTTVLVLCSKTDPDWSLPFSAAVLSRLSDVLPRQPVMLQDAAYLQGIEMADPDYAQPGQIDCILGGELYPHLLEEGLRKGDPYSPVAQKTRLGWILTGPTFLSDLSAHLNLRCFFTGTSTADQLRQFWEVEELPLGSTLTPEEAECEQHFAATHRRDGAGRYVVRLPFRETPSVPGSRAVALSRLLSLERRLGKDADLKAGYATFLQEYESLGHMARVDEAAGSTAVYLPHHAVCTKKLRVVYGAEDLNKFLHAGPKLQKDITTILTRWRMHRFVFTADIVKMFRQILVHPEDSRWQRILWRTSPDLPVNDFELLTVTYGTSCAPFLALRVLLQLAEDEKDTFPLGSQLLKEHFYVDDVLAGADTLEQALLSRKQVQGILRAAGMQLDKWSANHPALLEGIEPPRSPASRSFNLDDCISTLGLLWSPASDCFGYKLQLPSWEKVVTKRNILGEVARLYDPLGLLAPVVIKAKILLQMLWLSGHNWDDPVDYRTLSLWTEFRQQLPQLEQLWIPRWFGTGVNSLYTLHGFSDASEKAYAAAVYVVVRGEEGVSKSTLIAAKSKVAPLKTVSLPRLELCGALLLVKLIQKIQLDLGKLAVPVFCWTDSQVVLAWLKSSPHQWKTFVANRVSEILTLLPEAQWNHVRSALNPADYATRGLAPEQLQHSQLWWKGPQKLFEDSGQREPPTDYETVLEKRATTATFHTSVSAGADGEDFIKRFSSLRRMLRVTALLFRWLPKQHSTSGQKSASIISAREIQAARTRLISVIQGQHFAKEVVLLQEGLGALQRSSTLRRLLPFVDSDGLLRVGGRLQHAFLTNAEKHPVIIPKKSWYSDLLIKDAHLVTLHGGPQLTQSHLLRQCWIPQARTKIRKLCRECVRCCRFQGRPLEQRMAPLPTDRVTPGRPFNVAGVDYAGPFPVRTSKGRGQRSSKGYIVVFTCFVTRAVHIEVASDYTSKTFLLAFKRFVSRRGLCHQLYSDNGTTFQGADSELRRNFEEASAFSAEVAEAVQANGVSWSFIPPRAPHFGGLWEAAVKSFKHHLKRVVGDAKLTFEEFSTLAASIEACLNSRPLSPLSSDPEDIVALTPRHFLVGSALTAPPEPMTLSSVTGVPRWHIVSQMQLHFWVRWQKEVLHHLQQRSKWLAATDQPAVGDLVLLTDDLQPPLKWPLARISALHPGADGLVRVATLRTATTSLKRPVTKLIRLPINPSAADYLASQCRDQSAVSRSSF